MALAPLQRMNWPLGLYCFDPDDKIDILEMLITTNSSHGSKKLFSTGQWGIEKYYKGTNRLNILGLVKKLK